MATGAIEAEELAAADIVTLEGQGGSAIGVPGACLQESRQQQSRRQGQGQHQAQQALSRPTGADL